MKAWEVEHGELTLRDLASPIPGPGESVIRVSHVGICGSDRAKLLEPSTFSLPEPWRPGHEIVGVDAAGRVLVVDPLVPCNTCLRCTAGDINLCSALRRIGWDIPGGFAEWVAVPTGNLHAVPNRVDPLHLALADPAAAAVHGIRCHLTGESGTLAVIGAGTIGLLTALHADDRGWDVTILYRDGHPPSDVVIRTVPARFRPSSMGFDSEESFDVVVDAASGADAAPLDSALRLVRDGGTVVVQNAYHPAVRLPVPLRNIFRRSIRLIGTFSFCRRGSNDFACGLELLCNHHSQLGCLLSDAGELFDLPAVLRSSPDRSVRQILVCPSG